MSLLIVLLSLGFIIGVVKTAQKIVRHLEDKAEALSLEAKEAYEHLLQEKNKILDEKRIREKEASEIFTLYEMTKDIAKKFSETEALAILNAKLKDSIVFDECHYIDASSVVYDSKKVPKEDFVFTLQSKNVKIGYLIVKGLREKDQDKFVILGHQFALALRRIKLYQEIEALAITDNLTGLYTRRYFMERYDEELNRSAVRQIHLSFLMVDVDHFKSFNDKYGHLVGDQILRSIGKIVKESIREIDIAGRYGGEELCVCLPDTARDGAHFAAERIRSAIDKASIKAYDTLIKITVSIGIATFPLDGKLPAELIDKADWALYRAKKRGRNRICTFGAYE